jgi:hypothetical protein
MNAKKLHLFTIFMLLAMGVSAQQFTLSGKVSDQDGNAIELATVSCLEQGAVTMANLKGEYSLKLQSKDSVVVRFSMVGYQTKTRVLRRPRGNQKLQVQLQPMEALQEVVVTEHRRQTTGTEQLDVKISDRHPRPQVMRVKNWCNNRRVAPATMSCRRSITFVEVRLTRIPYISTT